MTAMTATSIDASGDKTRHALAAAGTRDLRLDFFRGLAMFFILFAHIPSDWLALWIPARFGFSDATEIFVFCSGMASALAFGRVFREQGLLIGTARVGFRIWQVYWAHIALFFAIAGVSVWLTSIDWSDTDYVGRLNLYPFFGAPMKHLPALLSLTYVPNFFDILPMYIVVLAMMPLVMALSRIHLGLVAVFVLGLWLFATTTGTNFPAAPGTSRPWFFNPLAWQLVFFTGFAFMSGWIKPPPIDRKLVWLALVVVVVSLPFAYFRVINVVPEIQAWRKANVILFDKTDFGVLRYVHFLALAYLAVAVVGPKGQRIAGGPAHPVPARVWARILPMVITVGQQSLAVFVFSMFFAVLLGALFDAVGRTATSMVWVNVIGVIGLIAVAYVAQWFKAKPWAKSLAGKGAKP